MLVLEKLKPSTSATSNASGTTVLLQGHFLLYTLNNLQIYSLIIFSTLLKVAVVGPPSFLRRLLAHCINMMHIVRQEASVNLAPFPAMLDSIYTFAVKYAADKIQTCEMKLSLTLVTSSNGIDHRSITIGHNKLLAARERYRLLVQIIFWRTVSKIFFFKDI